MNHAASHLKKQKRYSKELYKMEGFLQTEKSEDNEIIGKRKTAPGQVILFCGEENRVFYADYFMLTYRKMHMRIVSFSFIQDLLRMITKS